MNRVEQMDTSRLFEVIFAKIDEIKQIKLETLKQLNSHEHNIKRDMG